MYRAESVASWEKESGSVAKLWASNIQFCYCAIFITLLSNFDSNVKSTCAEPMTYVLIEFVLFAVGYALSWTGSIQEPRCMPGDGRPSTFKEVGNR